jgi:hypothetical protein
MDLSGPQWRKSSWSADENCVEVAYWRKSSRSAHDNCVEVGLGAGVVALRDTKNRGGGHLVLPEVAWRPFVVAVTR